MMTTITHLPDEVIAIILKNENINIEDILSLKSTCKRLAQITLSNKFWEEKCCQRYLDSTVIKKYNIEKLKKTCDHLNFEEQIKSGIQCTKQLRHYVLLMSDLNLSETDKEELEGLLHFIVENSMIYCFVWDELTRIISTELPWKPGSNLTNSYYFGLIFYCLRQYRFLYKQIKFKNKPEEKQIIERQLIILAQYFLPHVSYSVINTWLDDIAKEVLSRLKNKYPMHSIFSIPLEQFSFWRDNNISENFWNPTEATQIMRILEEYIFYDLEIHTLNELIISNSEVNLNFISDFQRHSLIIAYYIVARRLGIHCICGILGVLGIITLSMLNEDVIECKDRFQIIWKPKYNTNDWNHAEYLYVKKESNLIYPLNIVKNEFRSKFPYTHDNEKEWQKDIIHYIVKYLDKLTDNEDINYIWKFHRLFNTVLNYLISNARYDVYKKITQIIKVKSDAVITKELKEKIEKTKREDEVKFAIGMIVSYKEYGINYCGVIIGWHYKNNQYFKKEFIKNQKKILYTIICFKYNAGIPNNVLINKDKDPNIKPYYIILSENLEICYVEQDFISICPPKWINNIKTGRYFSTFEGTHYVPNKSLTQYYPTDMAIIQEILSSQ